MLNINTKVRINNSERAKEMGYAKAVGWIVQKKELYEGNCYVVQLEDEGLVTVPESELKSFRTKDSVKRERRTKAKETVIKATHRLQDAISKYERT